MGGPTPHCPNFLAHLLPFSALQLELGSSVCCSDGGLCLYLHLSQDEDSMVIFEIIISVLVGKANSGNLYTAAQGPSREYPHGHLGCGVRETLSLCWWECKLVQSLSKLVWRFLRKLGVNLPRIQQYHF